MRIAIDIDGVLCNDMHERFREATPNKESIAIVNKLYGKGHTIVIYTARGVREHDIDAFDFTIAQLSEWGVKYHELNNSKPHFDLIVDDRAFQSVEALKKAMEKMTGEIWEY